MKPFPIWPGGILVLAQSRTVSGLALELREFGGASPQLFAAGAVKFACLRPVFIRHLLDGLRQPTTNRGYIDWRSCIELLESACCADRSRAPASGSCR